ncbi:MAG: c-type cytochrome [Thermoflavifilum sp.]|nr:c-type cytochrome [Thermoflavifilum sp.]
MKQSLVMLTTSIVVIFLEIAACHSPQTQQPISSSPPAYGGYPNQVAWGKHLVAIGGCADCHTPKVMTAMGPIPDSTMYLAGHPAQVPPPKITRSEIEKNGLMVTNDLSVWIGPWGISYAANLTPDETGLKGWSEAQFITAIRKGKWKGLENSRPLLPPMSFVAAGMNENFNDDELKAIFAYLQTIKPIHNLVPASFPPVSPAPPH